MKAIRNIDNAARPARRPNRRQAKVSLPSEAANEPFFSKQARSYADCYHWSLTGAERRQWSQARSPVLASLRVFSCGIFVGAHGHWWERANLPEGILIYCTEGKGHYRQEEREYEAQSGDLLYAPPCSHHRYWADAEQPWTIYWMHLSGELLPHYERLLGLIERGPVRHIGLHNDIILDFTRLITQPPGSFAADDSWFCAQASAVAILGRIAALPHNISEITAAYGSVQNAISLMKASLEEPFDLPRFAVAAGCGNRHFSRQFRRVTGLPPGDWFIRQKMQRACMLLTLPRIQIKEVAARLGYTDPLYFSRIFRQVVGVPPEAYRRKLFSMHGPDDHPDANPSTAL